MKMMSELHRAYTNPKKEKQSVNNMLGRVIDFEKELSLILVISMIFCVHVKRDEY